MSPRLRRTKGVLKWAGILLGLLLLTATLVVLVSLTWIQSPDGTAFVREELLTRINAAIAGRVEVDQISLRGMLRAELKGVRLYAPGDSIPAASVDQVVLDLRLSALLARRIDVHEALIDHPEIHLRRVSDTTTLAQALASREPAAPKTEGGKPPHLFVQLPLLSIRNGVVDSDAAQPLALDALDIDGRASGALDDLTVSLALHSHVTKPIDRIAVAHLRGRFGSDISIEFLSAAVGESRIAFSGSLGQNALTAALRLDELLLVAADVNELAPSVGLGADLKFKGQASLDDGDGTVHLVARSEFGEATFDATGGLASLLHPDLGGYRANLRLSGVQPHRLRRGLPNALVTGSVSLAGRGLPGTGEAELEVNASGSRFAKLPIQTARLTAKLSGRTANISNLTLRAAGAEATAQGRVNETSSDLDVRLNAASLEQTRSALLAAGIELPQLEGSLNVNAHVEGPHSNPKAQLALSAPLLVLGSNRMETAELHANLSRVTPSPIGSFTASAAQVHVGERKGTNLWMQGTVDGHNAQVDARGELGGKPVQLLVRGQREAHSKTMERWSFTQWDARALGLSLTAEHPFVLEYGGGRLMAREVRLNGELGRLALDADVGLEGPLRVQFRLQDLHLEKLPADLLPEGLNLGGTLSLGLDVSGTRERPRVDGSVALAGGRFRAASALGLNAKVRLINQRLTGNLTGAVGAGRVELNLDVPVISLEEAFRSNAPSRPIAAALSARNLSLGELAAFSSRPLSISGNVDANVQVRGTVQAPEVELDTRVGMLSVAKVKDVGLRLTGTYAKDTLHAVARATESKSLDLAIEARLEGTPQELLGGDPSHLRRRKLSAEARLTHVDLAWLTLMGYGPPDLAGQVAGRLALSGTFAAPHLSGTMKATHFAGAGYRDLDALVDISADDRITVNADLWSQQEPLVELSGALNDSLGHIVTLGREDLVEIPLSLRAVLARTDLDRMLPEAAPVQGERPSTFESSLEGRLSLTGTLADPSAFAHLIVDAHKRNNGEAGVLTADLEYSDASASLKALFHSEEAGDLRLDSSLKANLGASALYATGEKALRGYTGEESDAPSVWRAGLATALSTPAVISLDADRFDLALANGFSTTIRNLGGKADLHLRKTGPLVPLENDGTLRQGSFLAGLSGTAAVDGGQVSVLGTGNFAEVSLKASGQYPSLTIEQLKGKAGKGSFEGHGHLESADANISLTLKDFPVVNNFEARGFLSLKLEAVGRLEGHQLHIPQVTVREGHMVIPSLPRRVQSLDPHPDIELAHGQKETRPPPESHFTLQIDRMDVANDFVIDAPLGNKVTLGAQLAITYDPAFRDAGDEPLDMTGKVQIVRGDLVLLRKFNVEKGDLTFFPHNLRDPAVNVKALYEGPDAKISLTLTGTLQDLVRHFDSTPPMEENEILYYLATGQRQTRPQQDTSASLQTQLADATLSALGAAAIGVVQGAVQQVLPKEINPDVLSVETDLQHSGIGRVRAGKYYLNGKLYVGGRYTPSANPILNENTYEGEAEYRLGNNQYLRLLVGNEGHHQFYYLIERNFPTAKQRKNGVR